MAQPVKDATQIPRKLSHFTSAIALFTVDFPIFFIESISERHVLIAGGGGSSKTGVHNQINILELVPTNDSCAASLVMKYQTPNDIPDAIMTGALLRDMPIMDTRFVGGGSNATIYRFRFDLSKRIFCIVDHETLSDSKARSELKTVKYTSGRILTGGIDGYLTSWNVINDDEKHVDMEVKAHTKEIDDIDVDTINRRIVTLSRAEGRFIVWNLDTLSQIKEVSSKLVRKSISGNSGTSASYAFRSCRYAYDTISRQPTKVCLLVACNPVPNKDGPCKIYKWEPSKDEDYKLISCGHPSAKDSIMAMTVSLDGKFVGVGTRSGGVSVLEVGSLRNIYTIDGAHHNAITSLEFLPPKQESLTLTNSRACPLLSASIDRRVILHRPKTPPFSSRLFKTLSIVLVIYLMFFVLYKYYDILSYIKLD